MLKQSNSIGLYEVGNAHFFLIGRSPEELGRLQRTQFGRNEVS